MICRDIINIIENVYTKDAALSFDNVGLLAGRSDKEVKRIFLALDATDAIIRMAEDAGADMLITHHPLIFSPLKRVTDEDFISRRVLKLIQKDISYYAMHTNYDVLGMAKLAGTLFELENAEVLDETFERNGNAEGIGRIGNLKNACSLEECCNLVKTKLSLDSVKVFGNLQCTVKRIAISPGAGKSEIENAVSKGADVLITGDIGHHEGLDAVAQNLMIIDAGHYGTEYIFVEDMKKFLEANIPDAEVTAAPAVHPFLVL